MRRGLAALAAASLGVAAASAQAAPSERFLADIVGLLLAAGAKTAVTGPEGLTPAALAREWNKPQVADRLER